MEILSKTYSIVDRDAIELISDLEATTLHKMRLTAVFTLLSLYVNSRHKTTRWGATACSNWLQMSKHTTIDLIKQLERLRFDNDEPLLEVVKVDGDITYRRPSKHDPIYIPTAVRDRLDKEPGTSAIEKMFHGDDHYPEKVMRLIALLYVYADFDYHNMVCPNIQFELCEPNEDFVDDFLQLSFVDTKVYPRNSLKMWLFPDESNSTHENKRQNVEKSRHKANHRVMGYLAQNGLISPVFAVFEDKRIKYVANYGSSFWREQFGNFQHKVLQTFHAEHADYQNREYFAFRTEESLPVLYTGGDLVQSVMPQYLITDMCQDTLRRFSDYQDDLIYELNMEASA